MWRNLKLAPRVFGPAAAVGNGVCDPGLNNPDNGYDGEPHGGAGRAGWMQWCDEGA